MLALATVRARWASFVGSFLALALGVAVLSSTMLVLVAAEPKVPRRYAGAEVLVRAGAVGADEEPFPEYLPWTLPDAEALAERLAALPGVTAAVPDLSFYAQLVADGRPSGAPSEGQHNGHSWSSATLAPYRIVAGRAPDGDADVALDHDLGHRPGDRVTLLTGAGPVSLTVTGTVDGPGFYLSDPAARRLASGVTVIGLRLAPDAEIATVVAAARKTVAAGAGSGTGAGSDLGVDVYAGTGRTALEPAFEGRIRWIGAQLLIAMAGLAGFVSVFVVASTFAFGIAQRRRELGLLRAVGATPGQVRRMVYAEAVVVGLLAGASGALLGAVLGPTLGHLMVAGGLEPVGFSVPVSPVVLLGTVALGLAVALLGVWSASRRAGRVRPLEALREAVIEKRPMTVPRWIFGGLCTAAGLGMVAATPTMEAHELINSSLYAAMSLILGFFLLAPVIIPPMLRAASWPLRRSRGATVMLVREGSLIGVRRVASTAAPVLLTVGFTVLIVGMLETQLCGYGTRAAARVPAAETVVTPHGVPGLSDAVMASVAGAGGVAASALPTRVFLTTGNAGVPAAAIEAVEASGVDATSLATASMTARGGSLDAIAAPDSLVAGVRLAERLGWQPGSAVEVIFADGSEGTLRVVALVADGELPAPVLLNRDTARLHDPSALLTEVYAVGTDPTAVSAGLGGLGGRASTPAEYALIADQEESDLVRIFVLVLLGLSVGYTGIAIANTLLMATAGRRRDWAVLRLSGATPGQVVRVVAVEAMLTVAIGALLGGAVALVALVGLRNGLAEVLGVPVELVVPWAPVLAVIAACFALGLAASVLPARLAVAGPPGAASVDRE